MQCGKKNPACTEKCATAVAVSASATRDQQPTWIDVAGLFPTERECLAAFLAIEAAEVLSGVKPANLFRIVNRKLPCGRRMYQLWQRYGAELLKNSPLAVKTMQVKEESILLLIYRSDLLAKRLDSRTMRSFLTHRGYPLPLSATSALQHLQRSFDAGRSHEIGVFLGYPIKDVKGFIRQTSEPWQGRGLWRIYGPPKRSLRLNDLYRNRRQAMVARLATERFPLRLLKVA